MRGRRQTPADPCTHTFPNRTIRLTIRGRREPLQIETAGELVTWWRSVTEWTGDEVDRLMRERKAVEL